MSKNQKWSGTTQYTALNKKTHKRQQNIYAVVDTKNVILSTEFL